MAKKKFWEFKAKTETEHAQLLIYGDISSESWYGDEVTPKLFKEDLDKVDGDIDIFINSGGGDVFAGIAIFNMIARYGKGRKRVYIDGLAASIASVIAMAGDTIVMPENAMMMIHNAWTIACGNKADLRKIADEMEKIDGIIADTYASRGGGADFAKLMDAETWFTAAEAHDAGLCDAIEGSRKIAASMDGDILNIGTQRIDARRYKDAGKLRDMAKNAMETAENGARNGDESQPVENRTRELENQRRKFRDTREKILEKMGGQRHGKDF